MKRVLLIIASFMLLPISVNAEENESKVSIGISVSEEQKMETLELLDAKEINEESIVTIDGMIIDKYLQDGSDSTTTIYSSSKVEFKNPGYGIQVQIVTPSNITSISESTYQNAAISAGVTNVDIKIASVDQVTGEGALAGVYEIFKQAGLGLESEDIETAENQIKIEKLLAEETNLTGLQISRLITSFNLSIVEKLENQDSLIEEEIFQLIQQYLKENQFDLTENALSLLNEHGVAFASSDVAKRPETKEALQELLEKYNDMGDIFSKEFIVSNGKFKIKDIQVLEPGVGDNYGEVPLLAFWYEFTLNQEAEPTPAMFAWMESVSAIQDNDPNRVNELWVGPMPDFQYLDSQLDNLKPGGTVEMASAFELSDTVTPVSLIVYEDFSRDNIVEEVTIDLLSLN